MHCWPARRTEHVQQSGKLRVFSGAARAVPRKDNPRVRDHAPSPSTESAHADRIDAEQRACFHSGDADGGIDLAGARWSAMSRRRAIKTVAAPCKPPFQANANSGLSIVSEPESPAGDKSGRYEASVGCRQLEIRSAQIEGTECRNNICPAAQSGSSMRRRTAISPGHQAPAHPVPAGMLEPVTDAPIGPSARGQRRLLPKSCLVRARESPRRCWRSVAPIASRLAGAAAIRNAAYRLSARNIVRHPTCQTVSQSLQRVSLRVGEDSFDSDAIALAEAGHAHALQPHTACRLRPCDPRERLLRSGCGDRHAHAVGGLAERPIPGAVWIPAAAAACSIAVRKAGGRREVSAQSFQLARVALHPLGLGRATPGTRTRRRSRSCDTGSHRYAYANPKASSADAIQIVARSPGARSTHRRSQRFVHLEPRAHENESRFSASALWTCRFEGNAGVLLLQPLQRRVRLSLIPQRRRPA
jgi:hypothetical protein